MNKRIFLIPIFLTIGAAFLFGREILPGQGLTPELENLMARKADYWTLDVALVKAFAKVESNFNPAAKNPLDPSYGLMQISPALAYDYGLISNWKDPSPAEIDRMLNVENNLDVGCWRLNYLTRTWAFDKAVQMYNVGITGYYNGVRNFEYLDKIRSYYEKYRA